MEPKNEGVPIVPRVPKLILNPTNIKYTPQVDEYNRIWESYGQRVTDSFFKLTGMDFKVTQIVANVGEFERSHSGHFKQKGLDKSDWQSYEPMSLRYNASNKTITLIHELTHRFMMANNLNLQMRNKFGLAYTHETLDLLLSEILLDVFNEDMLNQAIKKDITLKDPEYKKSWEWLLGMSREQRQQLLEVIVEDVKSAY